MKSYKHLLWPQRYETRYQLQEKKNPQTTIRNTDTWRLNSTFLYNEQITEKIKRKIKKFLETNDNENMTTQNLWDVAEAILRGKFTAIQSYLTRKRANRQSNFTPKATGKRRRKKTHKFNRRKQIINIWAEINEKEIQ